MPPWLWYSAIYPSGITWLSYNDPSWLAQRHGLGHKLEAQVSTMAAALSAVTKAATSP